MPDAVKLLPLKACQRQGYEPQFRLGTGSRSFNDLGFTLDSDADVQIAAYQASSNRVLTDADVTSLALGSSPTIILPGPELLQFPSTINLLGRYYPDAEIYVDTELSTIPDWWLERTANIFNRVPKLVHSEAFVLELVSTRPQLLFVDIVEWHNTILSKYLSRLSIRGAESLSILSLLLDQKGSIADVAFGLDGWTQLHAKLPTVEVAMVFDHAVISTGGLPWEQSPLAVYQAIENVESVMKYNGTIWVVAPPMINYELPMRPGLHVVILNRTQEIISGNILLDPLGRTMYSHRA